MPVFRSINVNGLSGNVGEGQTRLRSMIKRETRAPTARNSIRGRLSELSDESASRLLLQTYLEDSGDEMLRDVTAPLRPELVPDMHLRGTTTSPVLNATSLTYEQSASNIPVFGDRVVVDIDTNDKSLVSINGKVAPVPNISPLATLSPQQSWEKLVEWAGIKPPPSSPPNSPVLTWFLDEKKDVWRLVHHFAAVPFAPPEETHDEGHAKDALASVRSFPSRRASFDYFVDAHTGAIAFYFSSTPCLDIPAPMSGMDCFNVSQSFFGLNGQGGYWLVDPIRNIETYDYGFQDLDLNPPFPARPIVHPSHDFAATSPQAVSAHYHAKLVFDFYNDEMKRDGIDDKGMKLISVVNVYSSNRNPLAPPQWGNAVWWQGKMWYGEENGQSFAKYLDVIAHELTHGVTETSSALIYRDLQGALNESYSDIFGVIIANWFPGKPNSLTTWKWEIGAGLGNGGGPIRNFANPAAAGQPDHMNQYNPMSSDNGGVHVYSGIHNKAIYNLLAATDTIGNPAFATRDLVFLLYLTLTRLTRMSDFGDSRRTLENVTGVYYEADTAARAARLAAIAKAFDAVGIT